MSATLLRRIKAIKARLHPDEFTIYWNLYPEEGFDLDTWPAEIERRLAEAKARGERVIEIKRFYGMPGSKQPQQ
jgi:hypothetical protein